MVGTSSMRRLIACCLAGFACALLVTRCGPGARAQGHSHRLRHLPVRPGGRPVRRPGQASAAEAIVESLNAGKAPAPYNTKRLRRHAGRAGDHRRGGRHHQAGERVPQSGGAQDVDFVIGYISSGDCLAIAPVAEEMKKLTVLFDCGTPRVFEDASYKYVFRTRPHATMDAVAAALYLLEQRPDVKTYAGINQNYAWGQDSWNDFERGDEVLKPDATITTSQMPKFGAGQYGAEISALAQTGSDVIHSSLWGGDLEAFMLQAVPRDLFKKSQLVLVAGEPYLHRLGSNIPDGTIVGARGTHGVFAPDSTLNTWLKDIYKAKAEGSGPNYPAYSTALGLPRPQGRLREGEGREAAAVHSHGREQGREGRDGEGLSRSGRREDEIIAAFEGLASIRPAARWRMGLGKGHQAVIGHRLRHHQARERAGDRRSTSRHYPAERVQPPEGMKQRRLDQGAA